MKLGILCTMRNEFGKKGFYNSQEIGLGRQLVQDGHTVTIYKAVMKKKGAAMEEDTSEPGLRILYIPTGGLGAHGYLDTALLDRDLDGVLCFTDQRFFLRHVVNFCKRNHISFVPYFGTTVSMYTSFRGQAMNALTRIFVLPMYRKMRALAKTDMARKELEALGIRDVEVAPVGIDATVLRHDFRTFDRNQLRREYGYEPDDVVLFSVARMDLDKRPGDMVEILNKVKDRKKFRLLIVGKGPLREEVDQKIRQYGLEDRVKIVERVPYDDMWKLYRMADYFLNLNKGEIFGMAIMEAVYYCTSVAAISALGPSMTLKGMRGHRLCADDGEVADWICGPYPSLEELEESLGKILTDFSWEKCAKAFTARVTPR